MFEPKPPTWRVARNHHPIKPWLVLQNDTPVERFSEYWDAANHVTMQNHMEQATRRAKARR